MNKLFLSVALGFYTLLAQAEIQVQIDPSPVTLNESFQLTLTQIGNQDNSTPNLSVLKKDFLILGTARQVSYSIINGQSSTTNQWIISLKPLKAGVLSIPAIKMGAEQSTPMTINVEAAETQQDDSDLNDQALVLKTSVDQEKPYVNQEILYTVKLYNNKQLIDTSYEAPQAEDALIIPLGDAKRYQAVQNNKNYVVEEQQYAIFPQKSGLLKITSPSFTALVYDFSPQRVKAQDKETQIHVQPIPSSFQGKSWLPAKNVSITEHYENSNQTLNQGSTLVRTITIEGEGIPAQLLPNLNFSGTDAFNVYPEKGTDRNQIKQGELVGSTEFKVTYLFNKAGTTIIPELRVPWFNTQTGKEEIALLAPRSLTITPAINAVNSTTPKAATPVNTESSSSIKNTEPQALINDNFWPSWMALFFAGAWVVTLLLWFWQKRGRALGKRAHKIALAHLKSACAVSDPHAARDALLEWANLHWPDASILNLNQLTQLVRDSQLKKQITLLSQALYKTKDNVHWRGDELLKAVTTLQKTTLTPVVRKTALPPINPA